MNHGGYGIPAAAVGAPSSQRTAAASSTNALHVPSVSGVLSLLFIAVALAIIFHLLGVRFFVEVRRG